MTIAKIIVKNTFMHVLGRAGGVIIGVFTIGLLTRYLGQSGFGSYTTILAFVQLSTVMADLGLYMITLKILAEAGTNETKEFSNILSLRIISGLALVIAASVIVWVFPYPLVVKLGIILYSIVAWISLIDQIFVAGLQKHLSVKRSALAEIANKLVILLFIIIAIAFKLKLLFIISGHIAAIIVHASLNYAKIKQFIHIKISFNIGQWKPILKTSLPVALASVFTMIYFKADTIFLSVFRSQEEVGIYGAPYRILEVLISFAPLFMGLVMPILTKAKENKSEFNYVFQKTFDALSVIAILLVAITIPLAKPLIILIAGEQFIASAGVLQILIAATAVIYLAHLTTYSVIAIDKQKQMIKYYILAAALAVTGYITLIPIYSYWAAAWVTLTVEIFILIASYLMVQHNKLITISFKIFNKSLIAALITGTILFQIKNSTLLITFPLGIFLYLGALYLTKTFTRQELETIIEIRGNKKIFDI